MMTSASNIDSDMHVDITLANLVQGRDSDSEDEMLIETFLNSSSDSDEEVPRKRTLRPRVTLYVEKVVALYNEQEFKSHFRLSRRTFELVLSVIGNDLKRTLKGCPTIQPESQLMLALWKMATTETYRSLSDRFGVGKATAYHAVRRVTQALVTRISDFIKWPTHDQCILIKNTFQECSGFPDIIGALDGTHFQIEAPKENSKDYFNRKGYASIQMQAVCDAKGVFTHIFIGYPGSTHDMRVFRCSDLKNYLGNDEKFPDDTHLVADTAYAINKNMMVPYKDNGRLTLRQKKINRTLSTAQVHIERAFGFLKGRWRSLLNCVPMDKVEYMSKYIAGCCILHNICLKQEDFIDFLAEEPINDILLTVMTEEASSEGGVIKRNNINLEKIYLIQRSKGA